mgnify:CR=1 FL=1
MARRPPVEVGVDVPAEVHGVGDKLEFTGDIQETPDTQTATYEFEDFTAVDLIAKPEALSTHGDALLIGTPLPTVRTMSVTSTGPNPWSSALSE